jgi:hypothetical protein
MSSWGVADYDIRYTAIEVSTETPYVRHGTLAEIYSSYSKHAPEEVRLFMLNVAEALRRPATPGPKAYGWEEDEALQHRSKDSSRDASMHLDGWHGFPLRRLHRKK